jgi:N-acyl-D-amino-acid deacylase
MKPLLTLVLSLPAFAQYDLLIRDAHVLDGTGNPWFHADVAVKDGRITAVGRLPGATAAKVVEAGERVLAPGFIDVHTHVEGTVERVPRGDNFLLDGVTTIVTGNCGSSEVNLADWFARLEQRGLGLNLASLIGHNSVRREVMGAASRQPSPEELAKMCDLVDRGMQDGAVGFSTGLEYVPGTYSTTDEIVALAKAAARSGGAYASHMRDEGAKILEAIHEAARVGVESGLPVQISHFKIDTPRLWGFSSKSLALVEEYRRKGLDIVVDQYPYERTSTTLGLTLPSWALADGQEKIRERLNNSATRRRIAGEMKAMLKALGHKDYAYAAVASYRPHKEWEGKDIAEITALRGRSRRKIDHQIDTIFEIMRRGGAQMVFHSMGQEDIERIMRYPNTAIASDGGIREFGQGMPHPRSYGTNARVLAEYAGKRGVLTLEDAVRRMTSLPARTFGFKDRGVIREGAAADLVLFDPAKVRDKATYAAPHQYSEGFDFVIVNGVVMVEEGKLTSNQGGRVLRRQ